MKHREPQDRDTPKATLGRGATAAEAVRSRAATAGGLFAVAATVGLVGVIWQGGRFADRSIFPVFVAAGVAYVLAVTLFLVAALVPVSNRAALGYLMTAGTVLGVLAVVGTFVTALLTVLGHREQTVWVYVRQDVVLHDLRHSCVGLPHPFQARVDLQELSQPVAHVRVTCKNGATTFVLPSADVFVVDN